MTPRIIDKVYETGKKVAKGLSNMEIVFDKVLPNLNYKVVPEDKEVI